MVILAMYIFIQILKGKRYHGADEISGGPDDDIIYSSDRNTTESDGAKDIVNCGEGIDNVWINTSIDKDEVSADCEFIHKG